MYTARITAERLDELAFCHHCGKLLHGYYSIDDNFHTFYVCGNEDSTCLQDSELFYDYDNGDYYSEFDVFSELEFLGIGMNWEELVESYYSFAKINGDNSETFEKWLDNIQCSYRISGNYFCGNEVSEYAKEHGYVDYATLAKSFDSVLNNSIIDKADDWEPQNGNCVRDGYEALNGTMQWYIISYSGAEILERYTNENVLYSPSLDIHLWCVDHYGTSWSYVLTDIKIE